VIHLLSAKFSIVLLVFAETVLLGGYFGRERGEREEGGEC